MAPTPAPAIVAAIVARKRRKIFEAFRRASAVSPGSGKKLNELGITDSNQFRIQLKREVIVQLPGDKYYLDEKRSKEIDRLQYWGLFIGLIIVFVFVAIVQLIW